MLVQTTPALTMPEPILKSPTGASSAADCHIFIASSLQPIQQRSGIIESLSRKSARGFFLMKWTTLLRRTDWRRIGSLWLERTTIDLGKGFCIEDGAINKANEDRRNSWLDWHEQMCKVFRNSCQSCQIWEAGGDCLGLWDFHRVMDHVKDYFV